MNKIAIYPGTFDPVTNGHLDVIKRASLIFDSVIVGVSLSAEKRPIFSLEKRVKMLSLATQKIKNVSVKSFDDLLVDFARRENSKIIIRGLRAFSDFEFELQMGYANSSLDKSIDTIYLMPSLEFAFISSSVVRSILVHNGEISHLVPPEVLACM